MTGITAVVGMKTSRQGGPCRTRPENRWRTWMIKPQSSAFIHVCLVTIIDRLRNAEYRKFLDTPFPSLPPSLPSLFPLYPRLRPPPVTGEDWVCVSAVTSSAAVTRRRRRPERPSGRKELKRRRGEGFGEPSSLAADGGSWQSEVMGGPGGAARGPIPEITALSGRIRGERSGSGRGGLRDASAAHNCPAVR